MTQSEVIRRMEKNRQALQSSKVLAKAILRLPDGTMEVVAVYELSTHYEFYITYKTKSKNRKAPKKSWGKSQGIYARNYSTLDCSPIRFEAFVRLHAGLVKAEVLSMRVYSKRLMAQVLASPKYQSISHDWDSLPTIPTVANTRIQHLRLARKISGHVIDPLWNK